MLIANPIYDTVFKYLMDDPRIARVIISTIIGEEVEELTFKQRERSAQIATLGLSIFRLDFSAVVKTSDGSRKNVLIEIQKADSGEDLPRFRRYLAENYYSPGPGKGSEEECAVPGHERDAPMIPIITIYILGFALSHLRGHSAVMVKRSYYDAVTGEEIQQRENFIEHLTHDRYVIQISELKRRRRNKLECLLSLFEQMNLQANRHLKIFEEVLPQEFQEVQDRLYRAAIDREILEQMEIEDEFLESWKRRDRSYEQALQEAKEREKEAMEREKEAIEREKEAMEREAAAKEREKEERKQKDAALAELAELKQKLEQMKK